MSLTDWLERRGGLFLDSAFTLFFESGRSGSGELPEDNSSSAAASLLSGRIGSLPLLCLIEGVGWLPLVHFQAVLLPDEPACDHFLAADGQHDFTIQPFVWYVPPV